MRMLLLEREYYTDFDALQSEPIAVSSNHSALLEEAGRLNGKRTKDEIENGVEYVINPIKIKVI